MTDNLSDTRRFFEIADRFYASKTGTQLVVSLQCCVKPIAAPRPFQESDGERLLILREFFDTCLSVFNEALRAQQPHAVYRWLMNDTPASLRRKWHLTLPNVVYKAPIFFRTDESPGGRIFELQCPGSGWGDLELLRDAYLEFGITGPERTKLEAFQAAGDFSNQVIRLLGSQEPSVLHLLDNASNPGSMKYFIRTTSPPLRYWGYTQGVDNGTCQLVRSHSFFGLVAENLFQQRVQAAERGSVQFDLPPICLFDQKAPLALPFWEQTSGHFTDRVRSALVYSYPLTLDGFRNQNGEWIKLESFEKLPETQRKYFAKYAGVDVNGNWGSRKVFRLADHGYKKTLQMIRAELKLGRPWIIQPDHSGAETISYFNRGSDHIINCKMYAKYSRFYGPQSLIGTRAMFRKTQKVHGQEDTAMALVL